MLCDMQSVSSRIWTRVAMSISYDNNHYTMGTSFFLCNAHRIFDVLVCVSEFSSFLMFCSVWVYHRYTNICSLRMRTRLNIFLLLSIQYSSQLRLLNTQTASLQRNKTPSMSVLDMTLNNLMVRPQSWSFGECRVPLYCHHSQVYVLKW